MHGLNNDFVVLDGVRQPLALTADQLRFLADRNFGVGCDQILLVESRGSPALISRYRIFNADGGEVERSAAMERDASCASFMSKVSPTSGKFASKPRVASSVSPRTRWPGHRRHGRAALRSADILS